MAPPEPKQVQGSNLGLWAAIPIVLGVLVLVSGSIAGAVLAWRHSGATATPLPGSSSGSLVVGPAGPTGPAGPGLSRPAAPGTPKKAVPPKAEPPGATARLGNGRGRGLSGPGVRSGVGASAEVELPGELPPSPAGLRMHPVEATALLPLSPGTAIWGTADALVTVSVFGDLECEHTRSALRSAVHLASRFGRQVRLAFHHRPLDGRESAEQAARVLSAIAAKRGPDAAWRVLREVSASSRPANAEAIAEWLSTAGIERSEELRVNDSAVSSRVQADRELASELNVQVTPTVFVNGLRLIGEHPEAVLDAAVQDEARAVRWLRAQGVAPEQVYVRRVRRNLIGVEDGAENRACVPTDTAPSEGPSNALVTVVEFSDFECGYCRAFEDALKATMQKHTGSVRRVWRSFALPQHRNAERAAAFALAARGLRGDRAFWAVHAELLGAGDVDWGDERLQALGDRLGLDGGRLLERANDPVLARQLEADRELARSLEIEGVPTTFINGRRVVGPVPVELLDRIIRDEIEAARRVQSAGTAPEAFESLWCGG